MTNHDFESLLAERTAAPGLCLRDDLVRIRENFGRDIASKAARLALAALLDHVCEADGAEAADVLAAHGVEVLRGPSEPSAGTGCPDPAEVGRLALAVSGRMLADLHGLQEQHGGPAAVACAGMCAAVALGLVLDGLDAGALDEVLDRLREVVMGRQDRPPPRAEVRR